MEDLILSIEQCKHLKELGIDMSDAKLCWTIYKMESGDDITCIQALTSVAIIKPENVIPTYTLQEIWRKLPEYIIEDKSVYWKELTSNAVSYTDLDGNIHKTSCNDTEINNTYKMLCWIIENGYFKNK